MPFQGVVTTRARFPGRCPGVFYLSPIGCKALTLTPHTKRVQRGDGEGVCPPVVRPARGDGRGNIGNNGPRFAKRALTTAHLSE